MLSSAVISSSSSKGDGDRGLVVGDDDAVSSKTLPLLALGLK
jgi:hypothetical protein